MSYAAAALGWQTRLIHSAADDVVAGLPGLDRREDFGPAEAEAPDALLWVGDPLVPPALEPMRAALDKASWYGRANQLSSGRVQWQDIDSIHRVTHKSLTLERVRPDPGQRTPPAPPALNLDCARIARQRRSAVNFDGTTHITAGAFFAMLECLIAQRDTPPWKALASPARGHSRPTRSGLRLRSARRAWSSGIRARRHGAA